MTEVAEGPAATISPAGSCDPRPRFGIEALTFDADQILPVGAEASAYRTAVWALRLLHNTGIRLLWSTSEPIAGRLRPMREGGVVGPGSTAVPARAHNPGFILSAARCRPEQVVYLVADRDALAEPLRIGMRAVLLGDLDWSEGTLDEGVLVVPHIGALPNALLDGAARPYPAGRGT